MNIFTLTMTPINPPYDDAAKNIVVGVARRLKGERFLFVSSFFGRSFEKEKNMEFFRSPFQRTGRHKMSRLQKIYVAFCILFNLKKIDLLQFFITPQPYFSDFFSKLVKRTGKKSIQIVPSIYTLQKKNKEEDIPGLFFGDRVIVYSDFSKDRLEKMGVRNVTRIYPGIDVEKFSEASGEASGNVFKVVYPGTYKALSNSYSFDKFCAIARKVIDEVGNVEFIMACRLRTKEDVSFENEFKGIAEKTGTLGNFTFLNTVEDMPSLFRGCDVGVMPIQRSTEGVLEIPMVLPEMASSGKPVVYGNVPPMNELSDKSLGVMVSNHSPEAYADKIIQLLKDKETSRSIGKKSREAVVKYFNFNDMTDKYGELYRSLEECG